MSPNTTTAKQLQRQQIAEATARFLAGGGRIERVAHGASGSPVNDFDKARARAGRRGGRKTKATRGSRQ